MLSLRIFLLLYFPLGLLAQKGEVKPFVNSTFIVLQKQHLHYRKWEAQPPAKGNILLVHGFSGSTFSWRKVAQPLADAGYTVIAVDLPAYGFSEKKRLFNHSQSSRAALLWELADSLAGKETWFLNGHSMGGGVVGHMASQRPEQCRGLIFTDGVPHMEPSQRWSKRKIMLSLLSPPPVQSFFAGIARLFMLSPKRFETLLASAYGSPPKAEAVAGYLRPFREKRSAQAVMNTWIYSSELTPFEPERLQMPVLMLWGDRDTWVNVKSGESLHAMLPNSRMIKIPGSGHCPMETHEAIYIKHLFEFLQSIWK